MITSVGFGIGVNFYVALTIPTISQEVILDLDEFMAMMKDMMLKMAKSFGADEEITEAKKKEIESFEMNMENIYTSSNPKPDSLSSCTAWMSNIYLNISYEIKSPNIYYVT